MKVIVNDEPIEFSIEINISTALQNLGYQNFNGLAVARNEKVVPKAIWNKTKLSENDKLIVLRATQGG